MATQDAQIQCINKSDRMNAHERIISIGGIHNGKAWKIPQQDAVAAIEAGNWRFWTSVAGKSVWVEVAVSHLGNKYIKTQDDGEQPNNLLSLPECPG